MPLPLIRLAAGAQHAPRAGGARVMRGTVTLLLLHAPGGVSSLSLVWPHAGAMVEMGVKYKNRPATRLEGGRGRGREGEREGEKIRTQVDQVIHTRAYVHTIDGEQDAFSRRNREVKLRTSILRCPVYDLGAAPHGSIGRNRARAPRRRGCGRVRVLLLASPGDWTCSGEDSHRCWRRQQPWRRCPLEQPRAQWAVREVRRAARYRGMHLLPERS